MEKLLSTAEVAERLGMTIPAVQYRLQRGDFPNAQRVGRVWVIPESDLENTPPKQHPGRPRVRLTEPEYQERGLEVLAFWKRKPPELRCETCGATWRGWAWECENGCNHGHDWPDPAVVTNATLRDARKAGGLTQKELGQQVGVSLTAVSQWESRGTVPSSPEVRRKVREVLGVDPWPGDDQEVSE